MADWFCPSLRNVMRYFVALVALYAVIAVTVGCGDGKPEYNQYRDFSRADAVAILEAQDYDVDGCYREVGGNYDCKVADQNVWMHVVEDDDTQLPEDGYVRITARPDVPDDD